MNEATIPSIHGHEVIDMIATAGRAFSRSGLIEEIEARFGRGSRFHTCAMDGLGAAELVEFLVARGKLHGGDEALSLDVSQLCQH